QAGGARGGGRAHPGSLFVRGDLHDAPGPGRRPRHHRRLRAVMPDPLERLTNLVALLLEARRPLTLEQIADALAGQYPAGETARRGAFARDKAALRDGGVPIETEVLSGDRAGTTGHRIDRRRYELHLDLAAEETRALQLAVARVH